MTDTYSISSFPQLNNVIPAKAGIQKNGTEEVYLDLLRKYPVE